MIFADKLILLRKKAGWSQEELAGQMNVSRQSVSKWEGAQSIPDLEKIIRLSELFGVSTDYLLKDDIEEQEIATIASDTSDIRKVSMEEANKFLDIKRTTAKSIAYATFLCIISPVCLIVLSVLSELEDFFISENIAAGIGMITLLVLVSIAVAVFITCGFKTSEFSYLATNVFETEYGVVGMVRKCKEQHKNKYMRNNIIGTCLCIMSIIPLFIGVMINEGNDVLIVCMLACMFLLAGIGVVFFVSVGIIQASYDQLLQEYDYDKSKKVKRKLSVAGMISGIYWLLVTFVFLLVAISFEHWKYSGLIFVFAGILYPVIMLITKLFDKEK